jgi:UDPglucose--hexose-1-phosphate uridylyltransferase
MMNEISFHVPRFRVRRLPTPEFRKDPVVDRWVIVSTDRLGRTQELHAETSTARPESCPFCAGHEYLTPHEVCVLPGDGTWRIRVVPNMYPALRGGAWETWRDGLHQGNRGAGSHEVIVECPQHESALANLPAEQVADLVRVYRDRIRANKSDPRLVYPLVFKNSGADAGASLEHAHSQIITMPRVPLAVHEELDGALAHHRETGRCIFCTLLESEMAGPRALLQTANFAAFLPYAGRFPFECWLFPKAHVSHFEELSDDLAGEFGAALRQVLRKLYLGLDDPPYNYFIHTAPLNEPPLPHYHWHIEVLPRITGIAGFEWGTGFAINPVPPEQAAEYLRSIH